MLYIAQHVVGSVDGREFYGGKATFNVWAPHVETQNEFSLTQMWIISYEPRKYVDTIEAGWQASYYSHKLLHLNQYSFIHPIPFAQI